MVSFDTPKFLPFLYVPCLYFSDTQNIVLISFSAVLTSVPVLGWFPLIAHSPYLGLALRVW